MLADAHTPNSRHHASTTGPLESLSCMILDARRAQDLGTWESDNTLADLEDHMNHKSKAMYRILLSFQFGRWTITPFKGPEVLPG